LGEELKLEKDAGFRRFISFPERRSLGWYAYENLKQAIVNGELLPGERVVESRVADTLGISRTPVREAIHKLEREGRLYQNTAGGFFVAGLTRKEIEETFGIRSVLESYAARLAANNHEKEELDPLERKIEEFRLCLERKDMDALPRINTELHDLLYALSRSPKLIKMINELKDKIFRFRQMILKNENMAETSNKDHMLMLELIKKRDLDGVERVVREHILRGREIVLNEFDMHNSK
jgi:DNA-binding GntR family transcriptional regulator